MKPPRGLILFIIFITLLSGLIFADYLYHLNRIYGGVYVNGHYVGGLTMAAADRKLRTIITEEGLEEETVFFSYEDDTWALRKSELGVTVDLESTLQEVYLAGRKGVHIRNYYARVVLLADHVTTSLHYRIDRQAFYKAMSAPAKAVLQEPQDAGYILAENGERVEVLPDQPGRKLNMEKTLERLLEMLPTYKGPHPVELLVDKVEATRTAAYLQSLRVREPISAFSTDISPSLPNRLHNIKLAAHALDGTLIEPDKEFSFNSVVGPSGASEGYKSAPVIVAGELVEGIGGGVCQVSSTLYNAILLADVSITERRNHSLLVGYVHPGLDATISHGWIDLRFLNDRDHGVWIRAFVSGNRLTIKIYGAPIPGQEVKVVTTDTERIAQGVNYTNTADLPAGVKEKVKDGQPGYRVNVWRISYIDGEEIRRELLSRDTYKAIPDEYLMGNR
jgi:vancomycin resistance protein YoaR